MADKAYEYDLFIIHSSEDSAKATELMMDLENRFTMKCCFADREFLPGTEIIENITNFMDKSDRILMLISPASVNSGWCWQELQEAFRKNVQEKRNCIIPVLLEDTEVPKLLRNITYIDFQKETDTAEKIHKVFQHVQHQSKWDEWLTTSKSSLDYHELPIIPFDNSVTDDEEYTDLEESLEFMKEETQVATLQGYFDEALSKKDLKRCQCILENVHTQLSLNNLLNFCLDLLKEEYNEELVELVFKKLDHGLSPTDYKNCYRAACWRDIPCLVAEFNKLGCQKLLNASFVCGIILDMKLVNSTVENVSLSNILKGTKWDYGDLKLFLDKAISTKNIKILEILLSLIPIIPFKQFSQLILIMDEETCIELLQREKYEDQNSLEEALFQACIGDMKKLTEEILKQGVKLHPNFLSKAFSFGIVEILILNYRWSLSELKEMENFLKGPKCRRLLRTEIQKLSSVSTDKCTVLYERSASLCAKEKFSQQNMIFPNYDN
ncbi:uncharacterized protein LOC134282119 [Saccostrea cucullata]|uniref:uncharacterized protein LOC134282119 n=1 Tax=Saccostrea cuccullata TaxID=36930 RepID=UPI002ED4C56F